MELERVESICALESSSRSRLWFTRGDRAGTREVSVLGLGLSRVRLGKLSNLHPTNSSLVRKRPRSVELTRSVRRASCFVLTAGRISNATWDPSVSSNYLYRAVSDRIIADLTLLRADAKTTTPYTPATNHY